MNKKYLVDTHIFIWWMTNSPRLSSKVKKLISDSKNEMYLSIASIWEMAIKIGNKKLDLPNGWQETFKKSNFAVLQIRLPHAFAVSNLPQIHKDPFDRMLIAQSKTEKMTLITTDPTMEKYKVKIIN